MIENDNYSGLIYTVFAFMFMLGMGLGVVLGASAGMESVEDPKITQIATQLPGQIAIMNLCQIEGMVEGSSGWVQIRNDGNYYTQTMFTVC